MSVQEKRILLSPPHLSGEELDYVKNAFDSNWIAPLGPHVDAFEDEIANYVGVEKALALSSATAGVHLALRLAGVKEGDKVFCSTLTFVASANPICYQGGEPVFIDSEPESWNMSPQALERSFRNASQERKLPRAVIVTNLYGQSADIEPILELCRFYEVPLIEDAAESLGATYRCQKSGSLGDYGIYSFNGNKIITTSGGGMLIAQNNEALQKARFWATQSREPVNYYQHNELGYNYRMSNVLAAIGRAQFNVLEERIKARKKIFARYYHALNEYSGIKFMPDAGYGKTTRWLTTLMVDPSASGTTRDKLIEVLEEVNVESRPVWKPMHRQPLFKECRFYSHFPEGKSVSDNIFEQGLCLPSGSVMTDEEQERVILTLLNNLNR